MVHKFKSYIRSLTGRFILWVIKQSQISIWYSIRPKFKHVGAGSFIPYPFRISGMSCIRIGNNFQSLSGLRMNCIRSFNSFVYSPSIVIGDNVSVNRYVHLGCINRIEIGDYTTIASNVFITDHFHGNSHDLNGAPMGRGLVSKGDVIIGANSVVTKSFESNTVIAGVPAKRIVFSDTGNCSSFMVTEYKGDETNGI